MFMVLYFLNLRELLEVFPDAKVILTVRDPEGWYRSVKETIFQGNKDALNFPINIMSAVTGSSKLFNLVHRCNRKDENRFHEGIFFLDKHHCISIIVFNKIKKLLQSLPLLQLLLNF